MAECDHLLYAAEHYQYSAEQLELLQRTRDIGQSVVAAHASEVDIEGHYPAEAIEALAHAGLTTIAVPKSFNGFGGGWNGDVVILPLILMELASWCSSTSQVLALHNTGVQLVHALGSAQQQQFFFQEAIKGEMFASFGSEPGRDRFKLTSTLQQVENGFVLNGRKIFATGSPRAKWAIWRAVAAEEAGEQKLLMPLVHLASEGITVIDDWNGIGQRGTGSGQVLANQVFVPQAHVLGDAGHYARFDDFFSAQFNIHFAAQFVGIGLGALREATQYIREKARSWSASGEGQAFDSIIQLRLGEWSAQLASAKSLVMHAAFLLQQFTIHKELNDAVKLAASQAKVIATKAVLEATSSLFQVMGASAATQACNFDRYYRNARTLTLHDPVDRHAALIGQYELGLKPDKTL